MQTEGAIPVDVFAEALGPLSPEHMERLHAMVRNANWREVPGRKYDTAEVVTFWEDCQRAFFIRIPPGGSIPRHHDVFIPGTTHHLVVQTNPESFNGWIDTQGRERSMHLEQGMRYRVAREPLHWADNRGDTDRIHLLVEFA
jgi:aspartyl/asparaginyl beta-hydroxylase (cupin superfamily)